MTTIQIQLPFDALLKNLPQLNNQELAQLVQTAARLQAQRRAPSLTQVETELLLNINQSSVAAPTLLRCADLTNRQRAKGLSESEQVQLSALVDEIELVNARRLSFLAELAQINEVSIEEMMQRLDIQPITYG